MSDEEILCRAASILGARRADLAADALVVSFGSHAPNRDAMIAHYSVEIVEDGVTYRASAKHPRDAVSLARLKASDAREAKKRKAEKGAA